MSLALPRWHGWGSSLVCHHFPLGNCPTSYDTAYWTWWHQDLERLAGPPDKQASFCLGHFNFKHEQQQKMARSGLTQEVAGCRSQVGGFEPVTHLARGSAYPMEGILKCVEQSRADPALDCG